jgi:hypothetical protein
MVEIREKSSILVGFSPAHIAKKRKQSLAYSLFGRKKCILFRNSDSLSWVVKFSVRPHKVKQFLFTYKNGRGIAIFFEILYHITFLHENFVQLINLSRKIHNFFNRAKMWTPNLFCFTCFVKLWTWNCSANQNKNNFIFTTCTKHANQQRIGLQILT